MYPITRSEEIRSSIFLRVGRARCRHAILAAALIALAALTPRTARAQAAAECNDACCLVDSLTLNTGYDEEAHVVVAAGLPDPIWQVVGDDNAADGAVPRSAIVVEAVKPIWGGPQAGSQWISATPTSWNNFIGTTMFERPFCVCGSDSTTLTFDLHILVDDSATVYVDGVYAAVVPRRSSIVPMFLRFKRRVAGGSHAILVAVHNNPGEHSGVDIRGTISGAFLLRTSCCALRMPAVNTCDTTRLTLATDDTWTLIPTGDEPHRRCASIVPAPNSAWHAPIESSFWISTSASSQSSDILDYTCRKCFCVGCKGTYRIAIDVMSDDSSTTRLDGRILLTIGGYGFRTPLSYVGTAELDSGCHCVEIQVHDGGGFITGANAVAVIEGPRLLKNTCCACAACDLPTFGVPGATRIRLGLACVPNPVKSRADITCTLAERGRMRLELHATDGRLVRVIADEEAAAGVHVLGIDRRGLAAGAYHLLLHCGTTSLSQPIVIE